MKIKNKYIYIVLILLITTTYFVLVNKTKTTAKVSTNPQLARAINTCDGITDKSAAHLVAAVEFQKLEIAGRKAAVFKICMKDRGYKENLKWAETAAPIVEISANNMDISADEAFERLRRIEMKLSTPKQGKQVFWVQK